MKYTKGILKKALAMLLVITTVVTTFNLAPIVSKAQTKNQTTMAYSYDDYEVNFKVKSRWHDGYNAEVSIKNTSSETIENWIIQFPHKQLITQIWNATIVSKEDDTYIIKNDGTNQDIAPS